MTAERIVGYLGKVLEAEQVKYEEPALWQLGRAAQGSMRDALSLTDQAIAYGEGMVGEEQVNAMLGTMDRGRLFKLAEVLARADAAEVMAEVAASAEHAPDYDEVLQGLLTIWHRASLGQVVPDAIDNAEGDREAILQLSMAMQPEDLQLYYQIGISGRRDLALAPDPRQGFEMLLLRMLAFRPAPAAPLELDLQTALQKKKLLNPPADAASNTSDVPPAATPVAITSVVAAEQQAGALIADAEPPVALSPETPESLLIEPEPPVMIRAEADAAQAEPDMAAEPAPAVEYQPLAPIQAATEAAEHGDNLLPHTWWQWVERLPLAGLTMAIARNSALVQVQDEHYEFDVDPVQGALFNAAQQQKIQEALRTLIPAAQVQMQLQLPRGETPEQRRQRQQAEAHAGAKQAIIGDALVQRIVQEFDAFVPDDSIRPVS